MRDLSFIPPSSPPEGVSPSPPERQRHPRRKGPRPKHVPQRMCIACREHEAKRGLYRVVRTPEGKVEPDPTGRRDGRGAYLCHRASCWERALTSGLLARALNIEMTRETIEALRRHAATLPLQSPAAAGVAQPTEGDH